MRYHHKVPKPLRTLHFVRYSRLSILVWFPPIRNDLLISRLEARK